MYVNFNLRRPSADSGSILGANLRISNLTGEAEPVKNILQLTTSTFCGPYT